MVQAGDLHHRENCFIRYPYFAVNLSTHNITEREYMKDQFIDLGAGWFLFEDETNRRSVVCDALDHDPDRFFGPAAWQEASGPLSGKRSEEHTSELQSLMRISYAVFCLTKKRQ